MAKINGNTIKPGMVLEHNKGLWVVTKASHVKPGKGGAFANVEAKNLETGNKLNERFRSEDKVERVTLEQKDFSYLYEQGDALVFMDDATYEQIELQKDWVGEDRVAYLQDGMKVVIEMHEDRPIGLSLPDQAAEQALDGAVPVQGCVAKPAQRTSLGHIHLAQLIAHTRLRGAVQQRKPGRRCEQIVHGGGRHFDQHGGHSPACCTVQKADPRIP